MSLCHTDFVQTFQFAIYARNKCHTKVIMSLSVSKVFDFLALKIKLSKDVYLTLVGCYRPTSAISESLLLLQQQLSTLNFNEILLVGDFNWDWLSLGSNNFKSQNNHLTTEKSVISDCLNEHFISFGSLKLSHKIVLR